MLVGAGPGAHIVCNSCLRKDSLLPPSGIAVCLSFALGCILKGTQGVIPIPIVPNRKGMKYDAYVNELCTLALLQLAQMHHWCDACSHKLSALTQEHACTCTHTHTHTHTQAMPLTTFGDSLLIPMASALVLSISNSHTAAVCVIVSIAPHIVEEEDGVGVQTHTHCTLC